MPKLPNSEVRRPAWRRSRASPLPFLSAAITRDSHLGEPHTRSPPSSRVRADPCAPIARQITSHCSHHTGQGHRRARRSPQRPPRPGVQCRREGRAFVLGQRHPRAARAELRGTLRTERESRDQAHRARPERRDAPFRHRCRPPRPRPVGRSRLPFAAPPGRPPGRPPPAARPSPAPVLTTLTRRAQPSVQPLSSTS